MSIETNIHDIIRRARQYQQDLVKEREDLQSRIRFLQGDTRERSAENESLTLRMQANVDAMANNATDIEAAHARLQVIDERLRGLAEELGQVKIENK